MHKQLPGIIIALEHLGHMQGLSPSPPTPPHMHEEGMLEEDLVDVGEDQETFG